MIRLIPELVHTVLEWCPMQIRHRFISHSLNFDFHYAVAILNLTRESAGNKRSLAIRGT